MSLDKERGETDEAFVIRAEKERVRHKETEDVCLCLFLPRTSAGFQAKMREVTHQKHVATTHTNQEYTMEWGDLVKYARSKTQVIYPGCNIKAPKRRELAEPLAGAYHRYVTAERGT